MRTECAEAGWAPVPVVVQGWGTQEGKGSEGSLWDRLKAWCFFPIKFLK